MNETKRMPDDVDDAGVANGADATDVTHDTNAASTVVVSYPADLSEWGRFQIGTRHFKAYLRRKRGAIREGDVWEEFLDVGCCGDTLDVPLRVERVEDGSAMGSETEIEYEEREACGVQGGWRVQSADGPTR